MAAADSSEARPLMRAPDLSTGPALADLLSSEECSRCLALEALGLALRLEAMTEREFRIGLWNVDRPHLSD